MFLIQIFMFYTIKHYENIVYPILAAIHVGWPTLTTTSHARQWQQPPTDGIKVRRRARVWIHA